MFSLNKILFIYEGAVQEKKYCRLLMNMLKSEFNKNIPKEFIAFKTNIYGLYDEMKNNYGLDIVELIKERASRIGDKNTYNKLASGGFAQIYLIFDFDPQAPQYSINKIKEMLEYFNNETENGLLYVNYPMLESYKHFRCIPDKDYYKYEIPISECKSYKKLINNISVIKHTNDITSDIFNTIIMHNIEKYIYITKTKIKNYSDYLKRYNRELLLECVVKHMMNTSNIYVYNSSLLWGIDYFGEKYWNKYFQETISLENIPGYTKKINSIDKRYKWDKEEIYNKNRPF